METWNEQQLEIDQAVGEIEGYWRRAGIPGRLRRERSAELRDHLGQALGLGRTVDQVIDDDRAGFAAAWIAESWDRPWLDPLLLAPALVGVLFGGGAFLGAWLHGLETPGMPITQAIVTGLIAIAVTAWHLLRWYRAHLTVRQTATLGILIAVGYLVGAVALQGILGGSEIIVLGGPLALILLTAGAACEAMRSLLKRTGRL